MKLMYLVCSTGAGGMLSDVLIVFNWGIGEIKNVLLSFLSAQLFLHFIFSPISCKSTLLCFQSIYYLYGAYTIPLLCMVNILVELKTSILQDNFLAMFYKLFLFSNSTT